VWVRLGFGSCDGGNLIPVIVRTVGDVLPRVALFARRDICSGEELTFAYGPPNAGPLRAYLGNGLCQCGALSTVSADVDPGLGLSAFATNPIELENSPRDSFRRGEVVAREINSRLESLGTEVGVCASTSCDHLGCSRDQSGSRYMTRRCLCGTGPCLGYLPSSI
jgi:hypothetical protein